MDFIDIKQDYNPWAATSIFDFMFFCCPECDCKSPNKQDFVNHTLNYHSWVSLNLYYWYLAKEYQCSRKKIQPAI